MLVAFNALPSLALEGGGGGWAVRPSRVASRGAGLHLLRRPDAPSGPRRLRVLGKTRSAKKAEKATLQSIKMPRREKGIMIDWDMNAEEMHVLIAPAQTEIPSSLIACRVRR